MLVINQHQMQLFESIELQKFKQEMLTHSLEFAPQLCQSLDQRQLKRALEQAMQRAKQYGFTYRGPIRLYIEMMLLFGSDFHDDPQYPQFQLYLQNDEDRQMLRAELLYDLIMDYQAHVIDFDHVRVYHVLQHLPEFSANAAQSSQSEFTTRLITILQHAHPQKAEYIGEEALLNLITQANDIAQQQHLTRHNMAVLALLMFCFGHGCLHDPLYPWIAPNLYEQEINASTTLIQPQQHTLNWLSYLLQPTKLTT